MRVSTDEQAKDGGSLAAQEAKLRAYCTMRGEYTGGVLPIGNVLVEGPLQPDTDEAEIVTLIRTYRAEGISIRAIADRFNREGRKARGQQWHPTTVARILKRNAA
jgi:DNA invertase Pin-like site-specific DNA recombinase